MFLVGTLLTWILNSLRSSTPGAAWCIDGRPLTGVHHGHSITPSPQVS